MSAFHVSPEWRRYCRVWRPRYQADIDAGTTYCGKCHRLVVAGQPWDIGHRVSVAYATENGMSVAELCTPAMTQVEHRLCNRRDGQRIGQQRARRTSAITRRLPDWN